MPLRGKHRPHRMHEINMSPEHRNGLDGRREGSTLAVGDILQKQSISCLGCATTRSIELKDEVQTGHRFLTPMKDWLDALSPPDKWLISFTLQTLPSATLTCQYLGVNLCIGKEQRRTPF